MNDDKTVYRAIDTRSDVIMVTRDTAYSLAVWFLGRPLDQYIVVKSTGNFHRRISGHGGP